MPNICQNIFDWTSILETLAETLFLNIEVKFFVKFDPIRTRTITVNMLGEKLKELREAKGLVQRQVAADLGLDTAYISKMESNEKPVSRQHLKKLSKLLGIEEEELYTLWLADKVYDVVKDEPVAIKAMHVAEVQLRKLQKKTNK